MGTVQNQVPIFSDWPYWSNARTDFKQTNYNGATENVERNLPVKKCKCVFEAHRPIKRFFNI